MSEFDSGPRYIDDAEVAATATRVLQQIGAMSLATLGQMLSREFRAPLRATLGQRRLSKILKEQIGDAIEISGEIGSERVSLVNGQRDDVATPIRFDPAIWAAFAKPINPNCRRWLLLRRPFEFDDLDEGRNPPIGAFEIKPEQIPPSDLARPEREVQIRTNISAWCEAHNVHASQLTLVPKSRIGHGVVASPTVPISQKGLSALRSLVEAIPPHERAEYSVPLNLIGRLIS